MTVSLSGAACVAAESSGPAHGWPTAVRTVSITSTADGSDQPALFLPAAGDAPRPLLVALHSWSTDHTNPAGAAYATGCAARGWAMIHPDFRGPNTRPEAAGSDRAIQDVLDAVAFASREAAVDPARIYLVGVSGGGHMALLLAARRPEVWAAVSAWVPIGDLIAWHRECRDRGLGYADDIERVAGGDPQTDETAACECARRSPLTWLRPDRLPPLDICAGIHDGHAGSVPISHALLAFNAVAEPAARLSAEEIRFFVETASVPSGLAAETCEDATYGGKPVLFRRRSGGARITIFDGGHEIIHAAALSWLDPWTQR